MNTFPREEITNISLMKLIILLTLPTRNSFPYSAPVIICIYLSVVKISYEIPNHVCITSCVIPKTLSSSRSIITARSKALWQAGEMAYFLNCLPGKHEYLILIPGTHMKKCQK